MSGSLVHTLSKYLFRTLCIVTSDHPFTVKSSEDFLNRLRRFEFKQDHSLCSLDVTALFTSIPEVLALEALDALLIRDQRWKDNTPLTKDTILDLVSFCFKANVFQYNRCWYFQTNGVPMGSALSGLLAEAVMIKIDNEIMHRTLVDIPFYCRYVDDCFLVIPHGEEDSILQTANSVHPNIQFTLEYEVNSRLPYLDVLVSTGRRLTTSVYRKPCDAGSLLPFDSCQPTQQKLTTATTLFKRSLSHCSTFQLKLEEDSFVRNLLVDRGYPLVVIEKAWRRAQYLQTRPRLNSLPPTAKPRMVLPYYPQITPAIAKICRPHFDVTCKPCHKFKHLACRIKDDIPPMQKANVVYSIKCGQCDARYIGQTGRPLADRMREHQLYFKNRDAHSSALFEHCLVSNHMAPKFEETKILATEHTLSKRLVKESFFINSCSTSINRDIGNTKAVYRTLFHM